MEMMTVQQTCALLDISSMTLSRWRKTKNDFPKPRMKNKKEILFSKEEIINFMENHKPDKRRNVQ